MAGYLIGSVLVLQICTLAFLQLAFPEVDPAEEITNEYPHGCIEHSACPANQVTVCMDFHCTRDFSLFSGPPAPGTLGAGGDRLDHSMGLPDVFYAKTKPDEFNSIIP